jgi:uncharacterized protein (DUF305 family)
MKSHHLKICITSVIFTTLIGVVHADDHTSMKGSDSLTHSMQDGMKKMDAMKMTGDVDKDFAMMMKMHHQQALDMAQIEIDQGKSPEMKAMAKNIISAQKKKLLNSIAGFQNRSNDCLI